MSEQQRILTPTFALVSAATFCFFLSQSALFPVLPRHLVDLGAGPALVGLVVGIMLVPAVVLRPLMGRMIDTQGRKLFISLGFLISVLACLGYSLVPTIAGILALRLVHGAAMASFYPGASTLTADISPVRRRAEAFSYFSMFLFAGMALGPIAGEQIYHSSGASATFLAAAAVAALGLALALNIRDPHSPSRPASRQPLLHRAALFPAAILGMVALASGGMHAFIPLYVSDHAGDSRFFFATYAVVIVILRMFVGRIADRYGRGVIIVPGCVLCGLSSLLLATSASRTNLIAVGILFGLGWGSMFPGLFALIMDRVHTGERGSATATFTAAFDVAFGGGQILLGAILEATSFGVIFVLGGLSAAAAGAVFVGLKPAYEARFSNEARTP